MVVFRIPNVTDSKHAHYVLDQLGIGYHRVDKEISLERLLVNEDEKFVCLLQKDHDLEIYPLKNTNSVNYFHINYPKLKEVEYHVIRTKRWK